MSIKRNKLIKKLEQARFKVTVEKDGKSIKLKKNERRTENAARALITPSNAGTRFNARLAGV